MAAKGTPEQHLYGSPVYAGRPVDEIAIEVVIAAGESVSETFDFYNFKTLSLEIPATFTGDTITFLGSMEYTEDATHMLDCYNGNKGEINIKVVPGSICNPEDGQLYGLKNMRYLKLRSGTSGTPVPQAAAATIRISRLG